MLVIVGVIVGMLSLFMFFGVLLLWIIFMVMLGVFVNCGRLSLLNLCVFVRLCVNLVDVFSVFVSLKISLFLIVCVMMLGLICVL